MEPPWGLRGRAWRAAATLASGLACVAACRRSPRRRWWPPESRRAWRRASRHPSLGSFSPLRAVTAPSPGAPVSVRFWWRPWLPPWSPSCAWAVIRSSGCRPTRCAPPSSCPCIWDWGCWPVVSPSPCCACWRPAAVRASSVGWAFSPHGCCPGLAVWPLVYWPWASPRCWGSVTTRLRPSWGAAVGSPC